MLRSLRSLLGFHIHATDGELGKVEDFFFDDTHWAVRYLVVNTGGWLERKKVLVSPVAVGEDHWEMKRLDVNLSREQLENSPDMDTEKPVSRQQEMAYFSYYDWPTYWMGGGVWGMGGYPLAAYPSEVISPMHDDTNGTEEPRGDPHLHAFKEVKGYMLHATDAEFGSVDDFLVDDETWEVRYLVVDTRKWFSGKHVLIAKPWIKEVSWSKQDVFVDLKRDLIMTSPPYEASTFIDRNYEVRLHDHYKRPSYWNEQTTEKLIGNVHASRPAQRSRDLNL